METLISLMQMGSVDSSNMMEITDAALKGDLKRLYQLAKEGTQALSGVRDNAYQYAILNNFSMITGMIQGIILNGANVNARDDQGLTALHLAASGKHPISSEVVRALLNVGADPRAVDEKGNTPLHHAISLYDSAVPVMLLDESKKVSASSTKEYDEWVRTFIGLQNQDFYTDIIPSLIRSGADVNSRNKRGETPIHLASLCGHPYASEVVRTLISFGADVNATDNNDDTPLHRTVGSFNEKVAKVLLESGAKTGAVNNLGSTPLSYACTFDRTRDANITRLILNYGADTNARQYNGSFPLTYAALTEFSGVTKIDALVKHGANVKLKGTNGITALFSALCNNHEDAVEIVEALLCHGADVNDTLPDGKSMLHVAVTNKNTNVVEVLLKHGANVNAMESVGLRPLHELSGNTFSSVTGIARLLISKGASVDLPDLGGFTPLHTAASLGNRPLVKYLVEEAGADPALKNNRGFTPLKLASENGFQSVVEYLLPVTKGAGKTSEIEMNAESIEDLLVAAARHGRLKTLQHLTVERGGDISYRDPSTNLTIEEIAHMRGHHDVAWYANKTLRGTVRGIRDRPELDLCKSSLGLEDLMAMAQSDRVNSFITVGTLSMGIYDLHFQDERGMTHLHVFVEKKNLVGVLILLDQHALITAKSHDGLTPLDIAKNLGLDEIEEKLANRVQTFKDNEFTDDVIKVRYYTMLLSVINHIISVSSKYNDKDDPEAQKQKMHHLKNASWLISLGTPLEPPGSHYVSALHLAITTNCKPILTMLLAAGAPLYVTHNGLGPVETAWLTPDVTTWIAVTITRAVVNKLKADIPKDSSNSSDKTLAIVINDLIRSLNGREPWKTKYHCITNSRRITKDVVFRACEKGLTLLLWWMWSRKTNNFQDKFTGKTPLHIALEANQYETARALVIHMKVNPFIPDNSRQVPIDMFPSHIKSTMLKQCLMREFQHFDDNQQRLKDPTQIREEQQLALLLLTLFLFWQRPSGDIQLENFHSWVVSLLPALDVTDGKACFSTDWITCLIGNLKEKSKTPLTSKTPLSKVEKEITDYYENLGLCGDDLSQFLTELNNVYYIIITPEDFQILLSLLETSLQEAEKKKRHFETNGTIHFPSLLKKGLKRCCERKLPLFLHLLVEIAKVPTDTIIDDICGTVAVHHTAISDNMSATMYLKASGFEVRKKDKFGRTPSHFAYMYGNKDIGDYLKPGTENIQTDSGLEPDDMWKAYMEYSKLYGIDLEKINKPEFNECNNINDLFSLHLNTLVNKWNGIGMTGAVKRAKVDYSSGESHEVFTSIKNFLESLISAIGAENPLLKGHLAFVGSSEDDVRLITPDEYDCNFVLDNFSCFPHGRCKMTLQEMGSTVSYVDKKIQISFECPELEVLFEGTNLLDKFSEMVKNCLKNFPMQETNKQIMLDRRLSITPTSLKQTLVGTALRFSWNGREFPLLLIDVDIVPVIRSPWPLELNKPALTPDIHEVYINKLGRDEWRFSFAQAENMVMKNLTQDEKVVYLACKMIIGSMKTEGWMQQQLKDQFQFWDGRKMKIPLPNGFLLKSAFFFEREEVTDQLLWNENNLLDRMCSIFRRMCKDMGKSANSFYVPGKVEAYFGRKTQEQGVGYGAPEILKFLENWHSATNIIGGLYDYYRKQESA